MKASVFLVGEQKSGTSALHNFLSQHPDICMSKHKEPGFFCTDIQKESDEFHGSPVFFHYRCEQDYNKLFDAECSIAGESSSLYLYSKDAAKNIKHYNPAAKIVIILRHPVDFLISLHMQYLKETTEDCGLRRALELVPKRKMGQHIPYNARAPSLLLYTERVKYAQNIKRYMLCFPKQQIKIILFEEFRDNNLLVYKDVLRFLNVKEFTPMLTKVNTRQTTRFKTLHRIVHRPKLKRLLKQLPLDMQFWLKQLERSVFMKQTIANCASEELINRLKEISRPEVDKLRTLLPLDFRKWDDQG